MPELPDVEGFRARLERHGLGRRIRRVRVPDGRVLDGVTPQALGRRLHRGTLRRAERYGKYLLAGVRSGGWLVMHFGMTGSIEPFEGGDGLPRFAAVVLDFEGGGGVACTSQRVLGRVTTAEDKDRFIEDESLGPDALSGDLSGDRFEEMFSGRRGMVKSALMDQSTIAGIGNVWGDEILFHDGVHPRTRVDTLGHEGLRSLYRSMRTVLRTAAGRAADEKAFPRHYLVEHRDAGAECPRCGGEIDTVDVSGRTSYFCRSHQSG